MMVLAWCLVAAPVVVAVYAYAGYPALLRLVPRKPLRRGERDDLPLVSIVIPAYNEEAQIRGSVEALLAQDYPAERRQILILSDGSTDRTDDIVREYESRGVELLRMAVRGGKTAAENASIAKIRGSIVVNSDASIRMHPSAVRLLVSHMADPKVGVASSRDVSVAPGETRANEAEAGYVGYEMKIRALESETGGIVGASGSGYAIRSELHSIRVPEHLSRDFSAALNSERNGYVAVSVDDAICYVPRTTSLKSEYRRKVRTIARGMKTLVFQRDLMNPFTHGAFAWKLFSHKICRWLVPILLIPAAVGIVMLSMEYRWALFALIAGVGGTLVAVMGALWPEGRPMPRLLSMLTFAAAANLAVVHALLRVIAGQRQQLWEPTRREAPPAGA